MELSEKAVKLWEHLTETGSYSKADIYKKLGFSKDAAGCPACEYTSRLNNGHIYCSKCPIKGSWITSDGSDVVSDCLSEGSAFEEWSRCHDSDRRKVLAGLVLRSMHCWKEEQ